MKNFSLAIALGVLLSVLFLSIDATAQTKGWGRGESLGLGINPNSEPNPLTITPVPDATDITGNTGETMFLKADGTVMVIGSNSVGQLGNGTVSQTLQTTPVAVPNLTNVTQVAIGWSYLTALRSDGTVWSWGQGSVGQMGNGIFYTTGCGCVPTPTKASISNVVQIATGAGFTLALKADGTVWAWGHNPQSQLGNSLNVNSATPVKVGNGVAGFSDMIAVSAGAYHAMSLKADGTIWAWGLNTAGQLGNYVVSNNQYHPPVRNTTMTDVRQIASGMGHNLALKTDGSLWIWGSNIHGEVGNGTFDNQDCQCLFAPQRNTTMANVIDVKSIGAGNLVKLYDGTVWAWGSNGNGQMGNGTADPNASQLTPVQSSVGAGNAIIASAYYANFAGKPSFSTPAGTNVRRFGRNVNITFSNVISEGLTRYEAIDPLSVGINAPKGYTIQNLAPAYSITSTATTSGTNTVCLNVPTEFSRTQFALLKILHEEGSNLVDRTVSSSFIKRQICAGVDSLNRFVVARGLTPTSSSVTITGRILAANGRPIPRAMVTISDGAGGNYLGRTNPFGYYRLNSVAADKNYTFKISAKNRTFSQQTIYVFEEMTDLNFTPQ